ncbi:nuclear transport factor 2 family protein [Algibacter pectinivorans]|uniref:Predicted SnoaL-like aldol condensation-catalyzing enzyme n=1 Tax=Algibacter pectinivorans TaxID=870482 RepID=A0A1I1S6L2_9FLAO|nr:nuclear transport factor 2 family protein [Algibacter pectinivorans]SFD42204.1 Predicted SnoaL-like aldol condensation-catalyzing enzyme [Algibacter pectinivorans]
MKPLITTVALTLIMTACDSQNNTNLETMETTTLSNKDKAVAVISSLETGDQSAIAHINPTNYTQHNLTVADGLEGFGEVLHHAPEGGFKANVVRAFQDGDYAITHTKYDFFGPKVGFDIFKFENDLITEHWDNFSDLATANPSGRTQTDGIVTITDLDKTEQNKALVKDFINTVLINGEFDKMPNYFDGDAYIQHNTMIADGVSGLGKALEDMAKQGITMVFTKNHIVLGEGNFVLSVSEGTFAGNPTSFYDLFRIENGKIAEHWDTIETILPEQDRKNDNGKFNF